MISKKELEKLYVNERKTGKEIAEIVGVKSSQTIYSWLSNQYQGERSGIFGKIF